MKKPLSISVIDNYFDTLGIMTKKYLPQKMGPVLNKSQISDILTKHQSLFLTDICIFGIIDYSTSKYVFVSDNVSYLDISKESILEYGLPSIASIFHPDEVTTVFTQILPKVLPFLGTLSYPNHLSNAKISYTSRLRTTTGEYKWFLHQMSTLYSEASDMPLLILKAIFEISGIKDRKDLNLVLSTKDERGIVITEEYHFQISEHDGRSLSAREIEILQLISIGKTSKEIAHLLKISIHTVNNHRKNIMRKKDSVSMPEAITSVIHERLL